MSVIIHFNYERRIAKMIRYSLPQIVLEAKPISALRLAKCKLEPNCKFYCSHLKILALNIAHLDEQVIQNLTLSCPLIEAFRLHKCGGLEQLQVSSLPQLSLVKVSACREISRIVIEVPNLQTFCYENMHLYGELKNVQCEIYLETCKNLKRHESVRYNSMTLELLQNLSSKVPICSTDKVSDSCIKFPPIPKINWCFGLMIQSYH